MSGGCSGIPFFTVLMTVYRVIQRQATRSLHCHLKLASTYDDCNLAIYYDAWENDNDTDPIVSLVYEIAKQLGMTYTFDPDTDFLNWAVQF